MKRAQHTAHKPILEKVGCFSSSYQFRLNDDIALRLFQLTKTSYYCHWNPSFQNANLVVIDARCTLNKNDWIFNQDTYVSFAKMHLVDVCIMAAILFWPPCVDFIENSHHASRWNPLRSVSALLGQLWGESSDHGSPNSGPTMDK